MLSSLLLTGLLMGLAGGPHCVAMCGAACAGIGQAAGARRGQALWRFQLGRLLGYSALGAAAAASLQGLGWLTTQSVALRPLWSMFHVAAMGLGLLLLVQARQPAWLDQAARGLWARTRWVSGRWGSAAPLGLGLCWALLPCGLLYSAVMVAAMANNAPGGALVMGAFAGGSGITMTAGPWLWLRLRGQPGGPQWGVRLAGAALLLSSGWALWMALARDGAPWCATP